MAADSSPAAPPRETRAPEAPETPETPATARVEVIALDSIPEITPGDDLARLLGDAIERTIGIQPLRQDDVLVVTQKVVSKAEGAVVDLTTVEPRAEAIEFARRWDRDPRQIEVVLRQAKRVVRMERGVLITETPHGFVAANGGVDASNVGPGSGNVVTLLPRDPDASAAAIRASIHDRFGVDVPVVISDSFGRPWRWGIIDVAIGVSGLAPLEDLRGSPDKDGRIMKSTVRAVADEVASAAELVLGKTAGRPAAIVRGAHPLRADRSAHDMVMPPDADLFR
jgi:coenzyme F420-0:L-glutamate ligase/coenzyme F420-1:gamma-L-glutamate ligase